MSYPDVLVCRLSPDENGGAVSQKRPFITVDRLEAIASRYPTPFYLYDERGIRENARRVLEAFAWNPGFREYFAVKATPNLTEQWLVSQ